MAGRLLCSPLLPASISSILGLLPCHMLGLAACFPRLRPLPRPWPLSRCVTGKWTHPLALFSPPHPLTVLVPPCLVFVALSASSSSCLASCLGLPVRCHGLLTLPVIPPALFPLLAFPSFRLRPPLLPSFLFRLLRCPLVKSPKSAALVPAMAASHLPILWWPPPHLNPFPRRPFVPRLLSTPISSAASAACLQTTSSPPTGTPCATAVAAPLATVSAPVSFPRLTSLLFPCAPFLISPLLPDPLLQWLPQPTTWPTLCPRSRSCCSAPSLRAMFRLRPHSLRVPPCHSRCGGG
jgi:hypothetical protein